MSFILILHNCPIRTLDIQCPIRTLDIQCPIRTLDMQCSDWLIFEYKTITSALLHHGQISQMSQIPKAKTELLKKIFTYPRPKLWN